MKLPHATCKYTNMLQYCRIGQTEWHRNANMPTSTCVRCVHSFQSAVKRPQTDRSVSHGMQPPSLRWHDRNTARVRKSCSKSVHLRSETEMWTYYLYYIHSSSSWQLTLRSMCGAVNCPTCANHKHSAQRTIRSSNAGQVEAIYVSWINFIWMAVIAAAFAAQPPSVWLFRLYYPLRFYVYSPSWGLFAFTANTKTIKRVTRRTHVARLQLKRCYRDILVALFQHSNVCIVYFRIGHGTRPNDWRPPQRWPSTSKTRTIWIHHLSTGMNNMQNIQQPEHT